MSDKKDVLLFVIEDEEKMREILRINLKPRYNVVFYNSAEKAMDDFHIKKPGLIVTDVRLPGINGIKFMEKIKKINDSIPFIIFTGYGSIDHAVETMKKGAFDYLTKPIKINQLIQSIDRALSFITVAESPSDYEPEISMKIEHAGGEFITRDLATMKMLRLASKAAKFRSSILIAGETGTGKELVAYYIHETSGRKGPIVKLNCASIPKDILEGELFGYKKGAFTGAVQDYAGKIALSDGGTLFLDEIGELPLEIQAKLLNVLEIPEYYPIGSNIKRKIDLFLIAATNRNIRRMVDEGTFRQDLYYRIAVIPLTIPPLRERKVDILPLSEFFLSKSGKNLFLSPEAKLELLEYSWPGNVRELKNIIERTVLMTEEGNIINRVYFDIEEAVAEELPLNSGYHDIPKKWKDFKQYKSRMLKGKKEELERIFIQKLLIDHGGNISHSAKAAGIDRRQLQDMIKSLDIDTSIFRDKKEMEGE